MSNNTKKLINRIIMVFMCCMLLFSLSSVYALPKEEGPEKETIPQGTIDPDKYTPPTLTTEEAEPAMEKIKPIIGIISTIGTIASVVTLIALGIKYMIGSIEERAEYKKSMLPYIIGAFLLFAVSTIVTFIMNISNNLFPTLEKHKTI